MSKVEYTDDMDRLVMTTVGIFLVEPTGTKQVRELLGLLRKLVQSCLELTVEEIDEASHDATAE